MRNDSIGWNYSNEEGVHGGRYAGTGRCAPVQRQRPAATSDDENDENLEMGRGERRELPTAARGPPFPAVSGHLRPRPPFTGRHRSWPLVAARGCPSAARGSRYPPETVQSRGLNDLDPCPPSRAPSTILDALNVPTFIWFPNNISPKE